MPGVGALRGALRAGLKAYMDRSPFERGKGFLLRHVGPLTGDDGELVRHAYDGNILIDLDLGDYIQSSVYFRGTYEPDVTQFLCDAVRPGMDVVDIGANVGYYTLLAAKRLDESDRIHAFEPDATCFARLRSNVALNGWENVVARPWAVGETSGVACFYSSPVKGNSGLGALRPDPIRPGTSKECRVVSLDHYFESEFPDRGGRIGLVKIDVEGAELMVLRGADQVLRCRPVLILEISRLLDSRFGYAPGDLFEHLHSRGYAGFRCREGRLEEVRQPLERGADEYVFLPRKP